METEENSKLTNDSMLFYIPVSRLVIMSILSVGLYPTYWMYKNWKIIKSQEKSEILPFWRGAFGIFFIHNLFEVMLYNYESKSTHKAKFSSSDLATGYILLFVVAIIGYFVSSYLKISEILYVGSTLLQLKFLFFLPVQNYVNKVNESIEPRPKYNKWSIGHIVCLIYGGYLYYSLINRLIANL